MSVRYILLTSLLLSTSLLLAGSGSAQIVAGSFTLGTENGASAAPFVATFKTTIVQTLADGTTITTYGTPREARDSQGRRLHEVTPEVPAGSTRPDAGFKFSTVQDPVNHLILSWTDGEGQGGQGEKEASVFHLPDDAVFAQNETATSATVAPGSVAPGSASEDQSCHVRPEMSMESLGVKTVAGVPAEGTRITTTIPAGKEGNDRPLSIVNETWISAELKIAVLQINNDPRSGLRTMELTEIERGEPDPALFQVPKGYTVKEQNPQ